MGTRIKYDVVSEYVKPKTEGLDIPSIDFSKIVGMPDMRKDTSDIGQGGGESPAKKEGKGYSWMAWGLRIDLSQVEEITDFVQGFLEVVDKVTKTVSALIKVMRVFTSDFKSISRLLKVLLKIVVKKLQELIDGLSSTGIYVASIFPDFNTRSEKFVLPVNGGYKQFSATVNRLCLESKDEDAPRFGPGDVVGGLIIAMIGGTNDPRFLQDLITNFGVLSKLFRFRNPTPSPAKNVTAVAGFYKDPASGGKYRMGVKISWQHPGTPLSGFVLRRSRYKNGFLVEVQNEDGVLETVRSYKDKDFDAKGIKQFNAVFGRPKYHYIDFDVKSGETYYYKVFTTVGYDFYDKHPFYQRIESPTASKTVYAVPRNKIPLSELAKETTFDVNANRVWSEEFDGDWQSLSLRTLLGDQIDRLFSQMDRLSDKLSGIVTTSGDAIGEFIKFFEKKINFYMGIVNKIADILSRLAQLKMSGTVMLLWIEPEKGGMENFVRKYNSAIITEDVKGLQINGRKKDNEYSMASLNESGIMAGVVMLYGYPQFDGDYVGTIVPESKVKEFDKSLNGTKKALEAFTKILGIG